MYVNFFKLNGCVEGREPEKVKRGKSEKRDHGIVVVSLRRALPDYST